jgi:hypothetical protein
MPLTPEPIFLKDDLLSIERVLYEPISEELKHREIFSLVTGFNPEAEEIGYDTYDRTGSAKIFAGRAVATDIPFVGDKKTRTTQTVYEIATGIVFTRAERAASAAARGMGRGPAVPLDMLRVETARRFINEVEAKLTWVGDSTYGIKGALDSSFYGETGLGSMEFVKQGASGSSPADKRLWKNKTSQEIVEDLILARTVVGTGGIFTARNLALPHEQLLRLEKPYGADTPITIKDFLLGRTNTEGYFDSIEGTNWLDSANNGLSYDAFMVFDNQPRVGGIAEVKPLELFPPVYDLVRNSRQAAILRIGGFVMRHPAAFAVRKGI